MARRVFCIWSSESTLSGLHKKLKVQRPTLGGSLSSETRRKNPVSKILDIKSFQADRIRKIADTAPLAFTELVFVRHDHRVGHVASD